MEKVGENFYYGIQFSDENGDTILQCPRCGNEQLHHSDLISYDRSEDDDTVIETYVAFGPQIKVAAVPFHKSRNPSNRRDAIAVGFWCEICGEGDVLELIIEQHKGRTYMKWRERPPELPTT
jgi:hypothetical protein